MFSLPYKMNCISDNKNGHAAAGTFFAKSLQALLLITTGILYSEAAFAEKEKPVAALSTSSENLVTHTADLSVCAAPNERCISSFDALSDTYGTQDTVSNLGVLKGIGVVSVTHAVSVINHGNPNAIFLTQLNRFHEGGLATCHACSAELGVAAYVYLEGVGWKLIAASAHAAPMLGAWGKAFTRSTINKDKNVDVVFENPGRFYILLRSGDGGQGFQKETMEIIRVNIDGALPRENWIKYLGSVDVGAENCGGFGDSDDFGKDGTAWTTSDLLLTSTPKTLDLTFKKSVRKACKLELGELISSSIITYKFDDKASKFIAQ